MLVVEPFFVVVCFLAQSVSVTQPSAVFPVTKASFLRQFNSSHAGDGPDSPMGVCRRPQRKGEKGRAFPQRGPDPTERDLGVGSKTPNFNPLLLKKSYQRGVEHKLHIDREERGLGVASGFVSTVRGSGES